MVSDRLLPDGLELIHGPGCPVCVTPAAAIDRALELSTSPGVILCSYGDMLRVPGSAGRSLLEQRAEGANVRVVASPLDVLAIRPRSSRLPCVCSSRWASRPQRRPPPCWPIRPGGRGLPNLGSACGAMCGSPRRWRRLLAAPEGRVQGFLAAGHVCAVMGSEELEPICQRLPRGRWWSRVSSRWTCLEECCAACGSWSGREQGGRTPIPAPAPPQGNAAARALIARVFEAGGSGMAWPWRVPCQRSAPAAALRRP